MRRRDELIMPTFEIRPGRGVGPVEIGMTIGEAISAMERELEERIDPLDVYLGADRKRAFLPPQRAVHLHLDPAHTVEAVELAGPPPDGQLFRYEPPFSALYREADVFRTPARELVELVRQDAECEIRDNGGTYNFPSLGLVLWWGDRCWDEDADSAPFFEAVLVEHPGRQLPPDTTLGLPPST